jgi:hypothetical protein
LLLNIEFSTSIFEPSTRMLPRRSPYLSPFAFISLSSSLAIAMQQNLGEPGVQARTGHYKHSHKAMSVVSPLGVLTAVFFLPVIPIIGYIVRIPAYFLQ